MSDRPKGSDVFDTKYSTVSKELWPSGFTRQALYLSKSLEVIPVIPVS